MFYLGNKCVEHPWISNLSNWFTVGWVGDDEIFLTLKTSEYTSDEVRKIIQCIFDLDPDELSVEDDGRLRLWWD